MGLVTGEVTSGEHRCLDITNTIFTIVNSEKSPVLLPGVQKTKQTR